jgi:TPR repeat protein
VVRWLTRALVVGTVALACSNGHHSRQDAAPFDDTSADPDEQAGRLDSKCVLGDLEACRQLGVMYSEGTGVSRDPRRAIGLFDHACTSGNMIACNNLAHAYVDGVGTEPSVPKAMGAFQKACDGGYTVACRNLGLLLRDGRDVPADLPRAAVLLDKACKGKVPGACANAGDLDALMAPKQGPARMQQAIKHYKQGCDYGDPTACRQAGIAYLEGKGVARSPGAAAVSLERACLPDDPVACRLLGVMVLEGAGVKRDVERGKQLLARACNAKDDEACRLLALANEPGPDGGVVNLGDAALPNGANNTATSAPHRQ